MIVLGDILDRSVDSGMVVISREEGLFVVKRKRRRDPPLLYSTSRAAEEHRGYHLHGRHFVCAYDAM